MDQSSSQNRESTPQISTSHSLPRTSSSRCQTESPDAEVAHRQWQKKTKQRLAKSPHQSIESVNTRTAVYENDLKIMKKELARLQAAVVGLSTERIHANSEVSSTLQLTICTASQNEYVTTIFIFTPPRLHCIFNKYFKLFSFNLLIYQDKKFSVQQFN